MKQYYIFFFGAIFLVSCLCCNRNPDCEDSYFKYPEDWVSTHLDNSGEYPVISTKDISRESYGFRLKSYPQAINHSFTDCDNWENYFPFSRIQILSLGTFDGLPAGSDITSRFVGRVPAEYSETQPYAQYRSTKEMVGYMNYNYINILQHFCIDFILLDAPEKPDSLQLEVILTQGPTHEIIVNFPKIFLK